MNGASVTWRTTWWMAAGLLLPVVAVGLLLDLLWLALALFAAAGWGWLALELWRLRRWAERPLARPDQLTEVWREPVDNVFRSLQRARVRQQTALAQLRRNRSVTAALPDAAVTTSRDGAIEDFNAAAEALLGLKASDVGRNIGTLVRSPEFVGMLREAERDGVDQLVEFASPFAEGVRLEARRVAVDDGLEGGALLLVRDVTQLNRLLSMRQDFVANVSHELRTPLTVVLGYLEALAENELSAAERTDLVGRLRAPTARMAALVDDLLLLTRLESSARPGERELDEIDMGVLVTRVLGELPADGRHELHVEVDRALLLRGVESEIHSACSNLLTNAQRYSPDGGPITVSWQRGEDGSGRLAVTDRGIGIAAEHLARLTERFYRVDLARSRVRGGTGLGLAIVKHVLKRHDATLQVDSRLGAGSCFTCVFPARLCVTA